KPPPTLDLILLSSSSKLISSTVGLSNKTHSLIQSHFRGCDAKAEETGRRK
ncbi:OLC1v1019250C1, partial [Oldenlandia corymbosa var. corymbosa]